jgi:hypothetical protein
MAEESIRVCIKATQKINLVCYTYMTPAQWAVFKLTSRQHHVGPKGKMNTSEQYSWLDLAEDLESKEAIEEGAFEAYAVDDDGAPIEPRDEYTGK